MGPTKPISESSLDSEKRAYMSKVGLLAPQDLLPCGKMVLKPPAQLLHSPGGRDVLQVTWALAGVSEALQSGFAVLAEPVHH